jgi:hypothetical protein
LPREDGSAYLNILGKLLGIHNGPLVIKNDVIAYIEAERLRRPLPPPPARLLYVLFHRLAIGPYKVDLLVNPVACLVKMALLT